MDPRHQTELAAIEAGYWWHVAKRELTATQLLRYAPPPGSLIEGGIGGGEGLKLWQRMGYRPTGLEIDPDAVARLRERGDSNVVVHDLTRPWPVSAQQARAVVLLDVLEHAEDAVGLLRHAREALAPDGVLVLTVPACPWLFGPWDRLLGHCRRYTRRQLREHLTAAGLTVHWLSYWNAFSLPPAVVLRLAARAGIVGQGVEFPRVPRVLNAALIACACGERRLMRLGALPIGLSLAAVAGRHRDAAAGPGS